MHYFRKTLYRTCLAGLWICLKSDYIRVLNMALVLKIPGNCFYQDFEYASVLYIPWFWIFQVSEEAKFLNKSEFWTCQGSEYTRVTQASEYVWIFLGNSWICMIISEYATMLNTNSTLLQPVSLRSQFSIFEISVKKDLYYFLKTLYRRCLTGLWVYLRSWVYQGSEYARDLYIPRFWIC